MDKKDIIIFAAVFIALAIRLYMKYIKKDQSKFGSKNKQSASSFPSSTKDDDYEPYSKK